MADLTLNNVSQCFLDGGEKHYILKDINLTISAGEKVAIIGASGSGKSTLLHLLTGLLQPKEGAVLFNQKPLKHEKDFRLQLGLMFQQQYCFPELTVLENVSLPLRMLKSEDALLRSEKVLALMRVHTGLFNRYPHELSGGELSRVGLARALVHQPNFLVADEPTAAMDNALTKSVFTDIVSLQLQLGFTMVVATHDHSLLQYFDRVYSLKDGRLEAYG